MRRIKCVVSDKPILFCLWILVISAIVLFSCFGRGLQRNLAQTIGRTGIAWVMALGIFILVVMAAVFLIRKRGFKGLFHLGWMLVIVIGLMFYFRHNPEVWYHIVLFGVLGNLSVRLFSIRTGVEISFAVAFLDELLQHYLPNRVGDCEDVIVNIICVGLGIFLHLLVHNKREKSVLSAYRKRDMQND
ncbi:MAG: hypothetical protein WBM02_08005 [bacterium]